jgi:hypothetical protein
MPFTSLASTSGWRCPASVPSASATWRMLFAASNPSQLAGAAFVAQQGQSYNALMAPRRGQRWRLQPFSRLVRPQAPLPQSPTLQLHDPELQPPGPMQSGGGADLELMPMPQVLSWSVPISARRVRLQLDFGINSNEATAAAALVIA